MKIHHQGAPVLERRKRNYPPTGDALDAIAKGFRQLINQQIDIGPEAKAWVEECERVKGRFKKDKSNG